MNKQDLDYIKEAIDFVMERCVVKEDCYHEDFYNKTANAFNILTEEIANLRVNDPINMLRRFKNHAEIHGYPTKSFKKKVRSYLGSN